MPKLYNVTAHVVPCHAKKGDALRGCATDTGFTYYNSFSTQHFFREGLSMAEAMNAVARLIAALADYNIEVTKVIVEDQTA